MHRFAASFFALPLALFLSCAEPDPAEVRLAEGEALLTRALGGEVELRRDAIRLLKEATELDADHPRAHLMYGMALLSALAEETDLRAALRVEAVLTRAIELAPDDLRIPGWLAIYRVRFSQMIGTEEAKQAAIDEMIAAADLYPDFNNFSLAISFIGLPLDTPYPAMAVERMEAILDCGDRVDVCRNTALVPFNIQGSMATLGDMYARVGDREHALAAYDLALERDGGEDWLFRDIVEARKTDIDERIAAYLDDDPIDPMTFAEGATACVGCHQSR